MGGGGSTSIPETPAQIAFADVAKQTLKDYQTRWRPVENYFMSRVESDRKPNAEKAEGMAASETRARFGGAAPKLVSALDAQGSNVGSPRTIDAIAGLARDESTSEGANRAGALDMAEQHYVAGLKDIMAMGKGQAVDARRGMQSAAETSAFIAGREADLALQERAGRAQVVGQAVGTFAGYQWGGGAKTGAAPRSGPGYQVPSALSNFDYYDFPGSQG